MRFPDDLSADTERALVACIRILARRGRIIREERETQSKKDAAGVSDTPTANQAAQPDRPLPYSIIAEPESPVKSRAEEGAAI